MRQLYLYIVAAYLCLDKSTASRLVDALESKGHAVRITDPEDGRALMLKATRKGRRLHQRIVSEILAEEEELLREFSLKVRRVLPAVLRKLALAAARRSGAAGRSCAGKSRSLVEDPRLYDEHK